MFLAASKLLAPALFGQGLFVCTSSAPDYRRPVQGFIAVTGEPTLNAAVAAKIGFDPVLTGIR